MADTALKRYRIPLPGEWVQHADANWASNVCVLLGSSLGQFEEALVAFDMFKPLTTQEVKARFSPVDVEWRLRFLYAKAFVYGLDATRAFVQIVASVSNHSSRTVEACDAFLEQFGYIRDIRNSLQHIEERIQGMGSFGTRLPGPIINLGSLNARRFGVTAGDGKLSEVDISEDFINGFQSALLRVIWSVDWRGPGLTPIPRREPNA